MKSKAEGAAFCRALFLRAEKERRLADRKNPESRRQGKSGTGRKEKQKTERKKDPETFVSGSCPFHGSFLSLRQ